MELEAKKCTNCFWQYYDPITDKVTCSKICDEEITEEQILNFPFSFYVQQNMSCEYFKTRPYGNPIGPIQVLDLEEGKCHSCIYNAESREFTGYYGSQAAYQDQQECTFESSEESKALTPEEWDLWNEEMGVDETCEYWQTLTIHICHKHLLQHIDGCWKCESEEEINREIAHEEYMKTYNEMYYLENE